MPMTEQKFKTTLKEPSNQVSTVSSQLKIPYGPIYSSLDQMRRKHCWNKFSLGQQ